MNTDLFYSTYYYNDGVVHKGEVKPKDPFRAIIGLLPFTSNPSSSDFDSSVPLRGITGEFFRLASDSDVLPFSEYADAEARVRDFITSQKGLKDQAVDQFCGIMNDLMNIDGRFFPVNSSFLKYAPLESVFKKGKYVLSKYGDGQLKIAQYLFSMRDKGSAPVSERAGNLLTNTIREALAMGDATKSRKAEADYFILPFIRKQFSEDLEWLLTKEDSVLLGNIDLLLYFYCCYSVMQTVLRLDAYNYKSMPVDKPEPLFYILDHESASDKREVVRQGWAARFSSDYIKKLYGRMQTVDMLNTLVKHDDKPVGLYPELYEAFSKYEFDDNMKAECQSILRYCMDGKLAALKGRKTSKAKADDISSSVDTAVASYDDFFGKLQKICCDYQSFEYHVKMVKRLLNLMKVRLLQIRRGRGNAVLVLDNEMLTLLIALATREKQCKLKDMYERLESYGIRFDINTRQAIEETLLKLNILKRRSDSGEAQYVKIVL